MKKTVIPENPRSVGLNKTTALTYRLMRTDYVDINEGKESFRPSYSILMVESRMGDEARQKLIFDLSPEKERAFSMMNSIADAGVSPEEIEEILSEIL